MNIALIGLGSMGYNLAKNMVSKMRNAKIRLSNMKIKEFAQVLRGKSKWIKH